MSALKHQLHAAEVSKGPPAIFTLIAVKFTRFDFEKSGSAYRSIRDWGSQAVRISATLQTGVGCCSVRFVDELHEVDRALALE
jgi:hypothetical protein